MCKKNKIIAAVIAAVVVVSILVIFFWVKKIEPTADPNKQHSGSGVSTAAGPDAVNVDGTGSIYTYNSAPFEFDLEQVAQARAALIESGYGPVHIEHPYEGCELFVRANGLENADVPADGGTPATEDAGPPVDDVGHSDGDVETEDDGRPLYEYDFEPYNQFALLCGNGVRMVSGDLVFDVKALSNIRRADNGERVYPMISEEQAATAAEMWAAAEIIRETGSHAEQENAIILNGRMVPNAGFVMKGDVLYLPIEKLAKTYYALAEVKEGRSTTIRINGAAYTFYGDRLSEAQRKPIGIENREYAISSPSGGDATETMVQVYSAGGYIEMDAIGRVLGWTFELHGDYLEIITDPLDVTQNFVILPEHDMITLDRWFLNHGYTLYGWDEYRPKF